MPYDRKAREDAQITYYRAVSSLKRTLSDPDIEYLYQQQPVGIDLKGRIILRPERDTPKPPTHYSKLLQAVSSDIALHSRHNLINGVTLQHSSHSCSKYSPYKETLYLPRYLVNMTLPHRQVEGVEFTRQNGGQHLRLLASRTVGLPYGVYARLVLIYVTSERVRTKEREFSLGASWRNFLEKMGVARNGTKIQAIKEQLRRLCGTLYQIHDVRRDSESISNLLVADEWMRSENGVQITLSPGFFMMTGDSVIPLESHIVQKLRRSPLMLDLYSWLSCRLYVLKKETTVPWILLEHQFGADYKRSRDFRGKLLAGLDTVLEHKPLSPLIEVCEKGLHLSPGAPSDIDWMERMIARARSSTRHLS